MKTHERIKSRREELGLSVIDVAKQLGVSRATVYRYESAEIENMGIDKVRPLAKILQTSPAYLMGWVDEVEASAEESKPDIFAHPDILPIKTKKIPLIGDIACGEPIYANQDYESYVEVGTDVKADFAVRANGDSMINLRIKDGDIVFVREQPVVDNGEVAVVIIEDEVTLKRWRRVSDNLIMLIPENSAHEPITLDLKDNKTVHILGKAIAFQSDIR